MIIYNSGFGAQTEQNILHNYNYVNIRESVPGLCSKPSNKTTLGPH